MVAGSLRKKQGGTRSGKSLSFSGNGQNEAGLSMPEFRGTEFP